MIWSNLHADNIPVLWLADKFSDNSKISEGALGIGDSHNSVHAIVSSPTLQEKKCRVYNQWWTKWCWKGFTKKYSQIYWTTCFAKKPKDGKERRCGPSSVPIPSMKVKEQMRTLSGMILWRRGKKLMGHQKLLDSPSHFDFQEVHGDRDIYEYRIFSPTEYWGENEVNGWVRSPWKASLSPTRYSSRFEEVRPRSTNQERFIVDRFNGPESDGNPYPVQPSTCTLLSVS